MQKGNFTIIVISLFVVVFSVSSYAGNANKALKGKAVEKQILTDEMEANWLEKVKQHSIDQSEYADHVAKGSLAPGDTVLSTERDFSMNTTMGRKIALGDGGNIHVIGTQLINAAGGNPYNEVYNYYDASIGFWFGELGIIASSDLKRSGRVLNGPNGEAIVSFHNHTIGNAYLAVDAGPGFYSFAVNNIATGGFASADYDPTSSYANWICTIDADLDFVVDQFWSSTDGGTTWTQVAFPVLDDPTYIPGNIEIYPHFVPGSNTCYVTIAQDDIAGPVPATGEEAIGYAMTSNLGASWSWTNVYDADLIFQDGDYYSYLVANFSQWMSESTSDGTLHMVGNGYGAHWVINPPDTTNDYLIYDVIYWNSNMPAGQWVVLTDSVVGRNPALYPALQDNRSGNAIGNAFPSVAVHPDDGVIACIWQQAELEQGDTSLVSATDPTGTPSIYFATDIWGAISFDNGQTWSSPMYLAGVPAKSDKLPSAARWLEKDGNGHYIIHFVYMYDKVPGSSLFDGTPATPAAAWIYSNYDFGPVGIDDPAANVARQFALKQNYPNPFNPSTTISFNIQKRAKVTLDVYNPLGQKVKTLLNGAVNAGAHTVEFSGNDLSSGIYFYQLTVDNFKSTRKMVLMK